MPPGSILVVENDAAIRAVLEPALASAGFQRVRFVMRGDEVRASIEAERPSLVLLDLMQPGIDGIDVCKAVRRSPRIRSIPIIMLSDRSGERDIVSGLEAGADDYVTKPFSPAVLVARMKAVLRRRDETAPNTVEADGLFLDSENRVATLDGRRLFLTPTEFGLLSLLVSRPGRVYTRSQIIAAVQGDGKDVGDRTVDVQVAGLRRKLGAWAAHIEAVRGVGYRLARTDDAQ